MPMMKCPSCAAQLTVPEAAIGKAARCPHCKQVFRVPNVVEDTIASWLDDESEEGDTTETRVSNSPAAQAGGEVKAGPSTPLRPHSPVGKDDQLAPPAHCSQRPAAPDSFASGSSTIAGAGKSSSTVPQPSAMRGGASPNPAASDPNAGNRTAYATGSASGSRAHVDGQSIIPDSEYRKIHRDGIKLGVLAVMTAGVRLGFASTWMGRKAFRASMPFCCLNCQSTDTRNLLARPLAWLDKATGKFTSPAELEANYEIHVRHHQRVLDVLSDMRTIEELPMPFNEPLPYFVCTKCAASVHVHCETIATPEGVNCEVVIPSGKYALAWLGRVNGVCGDDYVRLEQEVSKLDDNSWKGIPEEVRKRLAAWFDFVGSERFIAYFADSDFTRKDHGLAGAVLTDHRLVHCKYHHHGAIPLSDGEPMSAVADGPFCDIVHHRKKLIRMRREDVQQMTRLLDELQQPLRLVSSGVVN
jgi:predicted Zn finger-like uncharacterized protein